MLYLSLRGIPWVFWSEKPGVQFFEVQSPVPERLRPAARRVASLLIKKYARQVWGVGREAQSSYMGWLGLPTENLPYFSDLSRFARDQEYSPDGKVRFLFAGRFSYRKGFDLLLEAFEKLASRNPNGWTLTLCGDGAMRELLSAVTGSLGTAIIDLGFVELAEMPIVMKRHDVLVAPSRYDGWGMVVPEAMAAGLPVIASDRMGSAVDIGDENTGLRFFHSGNVESLLVCLQEALNHRDELPRSGGNATRTSRQFGVPAGVISFREFARRVVTDV
jgi:glycosyltransferase involved in cell wall biosynthesis